MRRLTSIHGSAVQGSVKAPQKRPAIRPIRAPAEGSLRRLHTRLVVVALIASARTPEQLAELLPVASLRLTDGEVKKLYEASA